MKDPLVNKFQTTLVQKEKHFILNDTVRLSVHSEVQNP